MRFLKIGIVRSICAVVIAACCVGAATGQTTYSWCGVSSNDWENAANWTPSGVPSGSDHALIMAAANQPILSSSRTVANFTLVSGTLDLGGYTLTVTGAGTYSGGSIVNGGLVLAAHAYAQVFSGSVIGVGVSGTASSIVFGGSLFQQPVDVTRTGASNDIGYGTTTFDQAVSLTQSGTGSWSIANTGNAQFQGGLQVACTNSGVFQFGASGGSVQVAAGQQLSIGPAGFNSGQLFLRNTTLAGSNPQTLVFGGTATVMLQSGCVFNGAISLTAPRVQMSGGTFNGPAVITKTGGGSDLGTGGCTYHAPATFNVTGAGNLYLANTGVDTYHAGVSVGCTGSGSIQFGASSGISTFTGGGSITVGSLGFTSGLLQLRRINQLGSGAHVLNLGTGAFCRITGPNTFNGAFTAVAGGLSVSGSTFNGPCRLTKSGAGTDASAGGNTFNGPVVLGLSGSGDLQLHATGSDQFNNSLFFRSTGSGSIQLGAVGGTGTLAAGQVLSVASGEFLDGLLSFRGFTQTGAAAHTLQLGEGARLVFTGNNVFNGAVEATAGSVLVNGSTFNGPLRVTKTGTGVDACTGGNIFNALSEFEVIGPGAIWLDQIGFDQFNGDVRVSSVGGGGIFFGHSGGASALAAGRTIAVGHLGFNSGVLSFRNFQQQGGTPQTLVLSGNAGLRFNLGTVFHGDVVAQSAGLLLDGATFFGSFDGVRGSAVVDACRGGNTFHGAFRLRQNGAGSYFMATQQPDVFMGPAWFQRLGTGGLHVGYSFPARFGGGLSLAGTTGAVEFGADGGWVEIMGTGVRDWIAPAAFPILVPRLRLAGAGSTTRLFSDVFVGSALSFLSGVVQPMAATASSTGLLVVQAGATVVDPPHDAAYVDGWMRKVGNTPFSFPVGHSGASAPISISAPASAAHHFTARYRRVDPDPLWSTTAKEPTLDHLSRCEYWELERTSGSGAVVVTLSWDTPRSCGVDHLPSLRAARWDGTIWRNLGNGGATGTTVTGTVATAAATAQFGPFTLASSDAFNPLPVELLAFDAAVRDGRVHASWATASERDALAFELERSSDGQHFNTVERVPAVGNSSMLNRYEAFDHLPYSGVGYYRLRMIDTDGSERYSHVVPVRFERIGTPTLYPNPATDRIWLDRPIANVQRAEVIGLTGRSLGTLPLSMDMGRPTFDVSSLAAGSYFLRLIGETGEYPVLRFTTR